MNFIIILPQLKFHFVAAFDTANMHVECVTGINRFILLYYWFQRHTHSTPCSFAISSVKYSLLSSNCLSMHTHVIYHNFTYLGSELKETAPSHYATVHHKSFTATYCLYIATQFQLDFTHLQVCIMSTHLPNNIVQYCCNESTHGKNTHRCTISCS